MKLNPKKWITHRVEIDAQYKNVDDLMDELSKAKSELLEMRFTEQDIVVWMEYDSYTENITTVVGSGREESDEEYKKRIYQLNQDKIKQKKEKEAKRISREKKKAEKDYETYLKMKKIYEA